LGISAPGGFEEVGVDEDVSSHEELKKLKK
jgi:hypothetical protein